MKGQEREAAALRVRAQEGLSKLAEAAERVSRREANGGLSLALATAADGVDRYCAALERELAPQLAGRGPTGAVLASHLAGLCTRQRREFARLGRLAQLDPQGLAFAHDVLVTAIVLRADLEAHARDMALFGEPASDASRAA